MGDNIYPLIISQWGNLKYMVKDKKEKKKVNWVWVILLGLIAVWTIGITVEKCKRPKVKEVVVSKPDTVYIDRPYRIYTLPNSKPVLPNEVIVYKDVWNGMWPKHDTLEITTAVLVHDTTYIPFWEDSTILKNCDPYLGYARFSQDSIQLDVLKDGTIRTEKYRVYYDKYQYEYFGGTLHKKEGGDKPKYINPKRNFYTESYLRTSIIPGTYSIRTSIDYSLMFKKVGLFGSAEFTTQQKPNTQVRAGVVIKLK